MKLKVHNILTGFALLLLSGCGKDQPAESNVVEKPGQPLNYHALVIGIQDYEKTGWSTLTTAKGDAEVIGSILQEQYGFNVSRLTDADASYGHILQQLDQYMELGEQDALLIYFAGHGFYDQKMDEGYWIPYGAKRERQGLPAKSEWLPTSNIDKYMAAIPARHILVIADTCYGGALFRGDPAQEKQLHWYKRAINAPSRYVITSGNLEPVLDSGIRHSVFAQEIINFLQYVEKDVFAASDIGLAIRHKVSKLTGQLPRMGPLSSAADAGGEFIFVRNAAHLNAVGLQEPVPTTVDQGLTTVDIPAEALAGQIDAYALHDHFVRPRVLTCLWPSDALSAETKRVAPRLQMQLEKLRGCILVERDAFEPVLKEVQVGSSTQADRRATAVVGKILPASLILFGQVLETAAGNEIHVRVIESETSRVLVSAYESYSGTDQLDQACEKLAKKILQDIEHTNPLLIPIQFLENGNLAGGWGRFHGARMHDTFEIIRKNRAGTVSEQHTTLGMAKLIRLSEESSEFETNWDMQPADTETSLWLRRAF